MANSNVISALINIDQQVSLLFYLRLDLPQPFLMTSPTAALD